MGKTPIEWTDRSVNPLRAMKTGGSRVNGHFCQKISPGCANCYSSAFQPRFGLPQFPGTNKSSLDMGVVPYLDHNRLKEVLRMRKPAKFFWCDMTDMFGDWVPFEWIDKCFAVMALTPHLTHQVLTKRPARMAEYMNTPTRHWSDDCSTTRTREWMVNDSAIEISDGKCGLFNWPLPNVWLGTSCENQQAADERIPHLLKCPAAVRFISAEPLLGPLMLETPGPYVQHQGRQWLSDLRGMGRLIQRGIQWVIVGGESGHNARPCNVEWIRSIVQQCKAAGVPVFVKQMGSRPEWCGDSDIPRMIMQDRKGGDPSEWPEDLRVREFPR